MSASSVLLAVWFAAAAGYLLWQWLSGDLAEPADADGYVTSMVVGRNAEGREAADGEFGSGPRPRRAG